MRYLLALLILLSVCSVKSAEQIELFITQTNIAVTGDTLTINATTRTWTNAHSSSTILTNLADAYGTTTNLYFNLSSFFLPTPSPVAVYTDTNIIRLIFAVGQSVSASQTGDWADLSFVTNTITRAIGVRVPYTIEASTNQDYIGSGLVDWIEQATNEFDTTATAFNTIPALAENNVFTGTNSLAQGGWNNSRLTNTLAISGIATALTNGYWTNGILGNPIMTNGANYGNAFRSPSTGASSEAFGSNATATGFADLAIGNSASADGGRSVAVGATATASGTNSIAIGQAASSQSPQTIAIGRNAEATGTNSIVIGYNTSSQPTDHNSIAIGTDSATTTSNQVMLATSAYKVTIPGRLEVTGVQTNTVFHGGQKLGTSSGPYASLTVRRYDNATLAASPNTIDLLGSSYTKISGAAGAFDLNGITNSVDGNIDGLTVTIQNSESVTMTVVNDSGSAVENNRIYTGTGGNITLTNNPKFIQLIYDSATAHWGVINKSN